MTRYARAKGSKASNTRVAEEATPWHVMQQQMLNKYHESQENKQEYSSSITELNKKISAAKTLSVENKVITWTSFDSENESVCTQNGTNKNIKSKFNKLESNGTTSGANKYFEGYETEKEKNNSQTDIKLETKYKNLGRCKDAKKRNLQSLNDTECYIKKQRLYKQETEAIANATSNVCASSEQVNKDSELNSELELSVSKNIHEAEKFLKRKIKPTVNKSKTHFKAKQSRGNNYQGRIVDNEAFTMFFNGKAVKVVYYDGFLIQEKDAEELNKLKLQLIAKGIPRNEYLAVLKLERRKAEKALARERKNVCYMCRQPGHNFSECPEIETDSVLGYCFKCGSTEHTHFGCKVNRGEEYRFAQCFLCNEQGHIAKQCPDNPRGLYPKGGACHLCGDVTHFKKDCPKHIEGKVKNSVTIEIYNKHFVEALDEELHKKPKAKKISKNKIVSF